MISSAVSSSSAVFFRQNLAAYNRDNVAAAPQGTGEEPFDTQAELSSPAASVKEADAETPPVDNNVKTVLNQALLSDGEEPAAATREVEIDPSYEQDYRHFRLVPVGAMSSEHEVWAAEAKESTPENPVMYVETIVSGEKKAYLMDLNKLDMSNLNRAEALALAHHGIETAKPAGSLFFMGEELRHALWSSAGVSNIMADISPDRQGQINYFDVCRENFLASSTGSLSKNERSRIAAQMTDVERNRSLGTVEKVLKLADILEAARKKISPHIFVPEQQYEVKHIEDEIKKREGAYI